MTHKNAKSFDISKNTRKNSNSITANDNRINNPEIKKSE